MESRLEAASFKKKSEFFPKERRARAVITRGRAGVPEIQRARAVIACACADAEFKNHVSNIILKGKASRLLRAAIYIHIRSFLIKKEVRDVLECKEKTARDL